MADPIPEYLEPIFVAAGRANNIPPHVLAGMAQVETTLGRNRGPSVTGARGLMQFEPGTAAQFHNNPAMNDKNAVWDAAKLLNEYGYQKDPMRAIGAYNGGPGNPQYGYARNVMSAAMQLRAGLADQGKGGRPGAQVKLPGGRTVGATQGHVVTGAPNSQAGLESHTTSTPDWVGAGVQALLAANKGGIDMSGNVGTDSNVLSDMIYGAHANPIIKTTTTLGARGGQPMPGHTPGTPGHVIATGVHPDHPQPAAALGGPGGGFIPKGARYTSQRQDQGRDGITKPGGAIVAPGAGYVLRVASDPNGFGPRYPIVHFTSGPYAGKNIYLGHTLSAVTAGQHFGPGATLSHTGWGVGNATVPGWFEIGYAPGGNPGPNMQPAPFK